MADGMFITVFEDSQLFRIFTGLSFVSEYHI
jgi:hypothetical protein